jgi:hypothetical protein
MQQIKRLIYLWRDEGFLRIGSECAFGAFF